MITLEEAREILAKEYHIDNFTYLVKDLLLPDFAGDKHAVEFNNGIFTSVTQLGDSSACDLSVFEVVLADGAQNRRVAITQEMFKILRGLRVNNAIVAFANADKRNYRISLLTSKYEYNGEKIVKVLSNPRRYSYSLGIGTKTKTAYKFLIAKGKVADLNELINRFSVEVVNKQFYAEIATSFTELVGGERDGKTYEKLLNLHGTVDHNKYAEFGVRLIGRIMFCWFLREKRSENNIPLVPDDMLALDTINGKANYYHDVLEPLFFELLNTPHKKRKACFNADYYKLIPYLNGGLFSPHTDDRYKFDPVNNCGQYGVVTIPNEWFIKLYNTLGQYNFTVDENTAYDIELSIDPEMLGRIFENLLAEINPETGENAKKSTGSFYTPRDIVDYMVDSSLCEYLKTKTGIDEIKLNALISYSKEDDDLAVFDANEKKKLIDALYTVTVLDPACGSGAFPIGMLQKVVYVLQELDPDANLWFDKATENVGILLRKEFEKKFNAGSLNYIRKLSVIQNSIFGIDIQPIAVEISRLRCFLSLIIEEKVDDTEENRGINPLPNLDFKFIIANSLITLDNTTQLSIFENQDHIKKLKDIREEYFNADSERRTELKLEFLQVQQDMLLNTIANYQKQASARYQQLSEWKPFENKATSWFDPEWMFGIKDGFDIVIGNPPYISTKEISASDKKLYEESLGFTDDTYYLFTYKGLQLIKQNGNLNYIIPKTFWTTQTKRGMRDLLLQRKVSYIFDTANPFESVMVDTCIIQVINQEYEPNNNILFLDGSKNLSCPNKFLISQDKYINMQNSVIFKPTEYNLKIVDKLGKKVKVLYDTWWDSIKTSKDIEKNKAKLEKYRASLKPGDIALLGCLTEGGQGLATANNGKYIAVRRKTKWANNIVVSRPIKLKEAIKKYHIDLNDLKPYNSPDELFENSNEKEIDRIFDYLKGKYGRDIFGQGYIYRIIEDEELADISSLTTDEKENGIEENKKYYVPYDKGDKDGNRWYLETPFAIAWSKSNVRFLKTDPKARYQGYQFFFNEGFCWSDINTTFLKCRLKNKSINDVKSMSLYGLSNMVPEKYIISLINSSFISFYVDSFVNNTQTFQINDARQLPIVIPSAEQLSKILSIFEDAVLLKKEEFDNGITNTAKLNILQEKLDNLVLNIYGI